jgi:hypothetical protein
MEVKLVGTTMVVTGTDVNEAIQLDRYNASIIRVWADRDRPVIARGPECVLSNSSWVVACTGPKRSKLSVSVDMGGGNDTAFGPTKGPRVTVNLGAGDDKFYDNTSTDMISGGPGDDTVSFEFRTQRNIKGTPDGLANDGVKSEKDNIGTDVEHIILPPPR